jgi:hypothetical protein
MRNSLIGLTVVLAVLGGSAALLLADRQQSQPGMSPARFWINNRTRDEAIPVSIANVDPKAPPIPVSLNGFATVDFTDRAVGTLNQIQGRTQSTTRSRQPWEYREVALEPNQEIGPALNSLGADGWEAVGITVNATNRKTVLLKRPR